MQGPVRLARAKRRQRISGDGEEGDQSPRLFTVFSIHGAVHARRCGRLARRVAGLASLDLEYKSLELLDDCKYLVHRVHSSCALCEDHWVDAVGRQFEPYPYRRFIDGALVV